MSKVTSKLQVTIPKALAVRYGIRPGDEIGWEEAGDTIRVVPAAAKARIGTVERCLEVFDAATKRQLARQGKTKSKRAKDRGWTRQELYERGRTR